MNERDLMSCAQTGSGKTAAFLIPTINILINKSYEHASMSKIEYVNNFKRVQPLCLILTPTRELALQIFDEACKFTLRTRIRPCVVYGGENIHMQISDLKKGCDILIGTPGRVIDLCDREKLSFKRINVLILDEADRMLDMGFEPQIRLIVESDHMPCNKYRQTLMFSATFPQKIQQLAGEFLKNDYIFLAIGRVGSACSSIKQQIEWVNENEKHLFLLDLLDLQPNILKLIFVETKRRARELEIYLNDKNYSAIAIHGDKNQQERIQALDLFRTGRVKILVATAVAARGLDVNDIGFVINFDLPHDIDDYVHRIGRTGRAGCSGKAISFFNENNINLAVDLGHLLAETKQNIPAFLSKYIGVKKTERKIETSYSNSKNYNYDSRRNLTNKTSYKLGRIKNNEIDYENQHLKIKPCDDLDWFDRN